MELNLKRPIVFFDLETTGVDPAHDRIVEISMIKISPDGEETVKTRRLNPEMPIPPEATAVHGITDEDVKDCPTFARIARSLEAFLVGCDFGGFNSNRFDLPVLVDRAELINGIRRVAVCSNPTTNLIRMNIGGDKIGLTAQDLDFSVSANETISCSYEGQPIPIGFKSTFLVEILANIDTPTVVIELADSTRAGVFKPVYDDKQTSSTLMLLMPMMLND